MVPEKEEGEAEIIGEEGEKQVEERVRLEESSKPQGEK